MGLIGEMGLMEIGLIGEMGLMFRERREAQFTGKIGKAEAPRTLAHSAHRHISAREMREDTISQHPSYQSHPAYFHSSHKAYLSHQLISPIRPIRPISPSTKHTLERSCA